MWFHVFHGWIRASKLRLFRRIRRAEHGIQCMPCPAQCAEESEVSGLEMSRISAFKIFQWMIVDILKYDSGG